MFLPTFVIYIFRQIPRIVCSEVVLSKINSQTKNPEPSFEYSFILFLHSDSKLKREIQDYTSFFQCIITIPPSVELMINCNPLCRF